MLKGKVVLVPFPFDDLSSSKPRPAVCLTDAIGVHSHVVIAFITSQEPTERLGSDLILDPTSDAGMSTGLRVRSTLRLHRMVTLATAMIRRQLGAISAPMQIEVDERLRNLFGLDPGSPPLEKSQ